MLENLILRTYLILRSIIYNDFSFWEFLSGPASPRMSPSGPEVVCTVKGVRFSSMLTPLFLRFWFQLKGSATFTFMWTWLALSPGPGVLPTSSPLWKKPPVGQRPFPCPQPPLRIVLEPWFPVGSPGLVFQPRLHLTIELNSPHLSGVFYVPFWPFPVPHQCPFSI